ncbi:alpha/beta hydrolase fold domain-containing protein [Patescibacteria group bacterium]
MAIYKSDKKCDSFWSLKCRPTLFGFGVMAAIVIGAGILVASVFYGNYQEDLGLRKVKNARAFYNLEYARQGDRALLLDIYLPKGEKDPLPVIVWIFGGVWMWGDKTECPAEIFVEHGYAVACINYSYMTQATFPEQLYEAKSAIRWIRANASLYQFDSERIGVFGESSGGHLAALLGTTCGVEKLEGDIGVTGYSSCVDAIVEWFGPLEFIEINKDRSTDNPYKKFRMVTEVYLGGSLRAVLENAHLATPKEHVTPDDAPFYILHGEEDEWIPVTQPKALHQALQEAGVESHLEIIEGMMHGWGTDNYGKKVFPPEMLEKMIVEFLDKKLK